MRERCVSGAGAGEEEAFTYTPCGMIQVDSLGVIGST